MRSKLSLPMIISPDSMMIVDQLVPTGVQSWQSDHMSPSWLSSPSQGCQCPIMATFVGDSLQPECPLIVYARLYHDGSLLMDCVPIMINCFLRTTSFMNVSPYGCNLHHDDLTFWLHSSYNWPIPMTDISSWTTSPQGWPLLMTALSSWLTSPQNWPLIIAELSSFPQEWVSSWMKSPRGFWSPPLIVMTNLIS